MPFMPSITSSNALGSLSEIGGAGGKVGTSVFAQLVSKCTILFASRDSAGMSFPAESRGYGAFSRLLG